MKTDATLHIDFAGEEHDLQQGSDFRIGRRGDLVIDDNPYLHRDFIVITFSDGFWWIHNVGGRLPIQVTDRLGLLKAVLAPGARTPLVFDVTLLVFSAGSTTYEIELTAPIDGYVPESALPSGALASGETTMGATDFTESQLLAILALAEPLLRNPGSGAERLPTSVDASRRLGWTITRFNRKLDNVCEKLERAGVSGLRGSTGAGAANRRVRLVEYAIDTLLTSANDLPKLRAEAMANAAVRRGRSEGAER